VRLLSITTALILLLFQSLQAETGHQPYEKGKISLVGSLAVSHTTGDNTDPEGITRVNMNVACGFFVADHFALGFITTLSTNSQREYYNSFSFGPLVAVQFGGAPDKVSGSVYPFIRGYAQHGWVNDRYASHRNVVGGALGVTLMASNTVGLDIGFEVFHENVADVVYPYSYSFYPHTTDVSATTVLVSLGLTAFLN